MKSSSREFGSPASGSTTPSAPLGSTRAETALVWSVMSVTSAVPPVVAVTLPTSPSPVTTGSFTRTPSPDPTSTVTLEDQTVGERPMTRPVTGLYGASGPLWSRLSSLRNWLFSPTASSYFVFFTASARTSALSWPFSPRALNVSWNQLTRSRAGFSARLAPSSTGPSTVATPSRIVPNGPPDEPAKVLVRSTTDAATSSTRTARRRRTCLRYIGGLPDAREPASAQNG